MRIGQGFDVHAFIEGRQLVLGGVTVPHNRGLSGHSDADVLLHAVCDALLGAAGLGDIGRHFPDSDAQYKDINSRLLLKDVVAKLADMQLKVSNLDCTLVAQEPKLAPYIDTMQYNIANDIGIGPKQVNVKATTTEHLGFAGRKEGIAAFAVVLLSD
jgi:2-C-methyl-D-erythritol 2,4-cyclodiphosphate synthase